MNLRLPVTLVVFLFSLMFAIQIVVLANGDIVNNYPYISPDGFDWYMQGVYLDKVLSGATLPELPVLRPPLFVLITAADYIAGGRGLIFSLAIGLAIFFTYYFTLKIVDSAYGEESRKSWYILPLAISATVYPINFFKPYLLADSLAVTLSLASVLLLVKYHKEEKLHFLAISIAAAVLAGLTQTYGLIPFAVSCMVGFLFNIHSNKLKSRNFITSAFIASVLFISFTLLWRWIMPHETTPKNFELLKVSTAMFGFYARTWGYYFIPLMIFFIIFRRLKTAWHTSRFIISSSTIVVIFFALLCLFYQWPEARFTYFFWPWLMILMFSSIRLDSVKGAYLIPILMLLLVALVPNNYWSPSWQSMRVSVLDNWVGEYFMSSPIDRKLNACVGECMKKNEFLIKSDPYVNATITIYNQINGL